MIVRVIAVGLGIAAVAIGAGFAAWYLPFAAGVVVGAMSVRRRIRPAARAGLALALGPLAWGIVLAVRAGAGDTVGATGRTIAALAGLPPSAVVTVALSLLVPLLQTLVGIWLGRAAAPRPGRGARTILNIAPTSSADSSGANIRTDT